MRVCCKFFLFLLLIVLSVASMFGYALLGCGKPTGNEELIWQKLTDWHKRLDSAKTSELATVAAAVSKEMAKLLSIPDPEKKSTSICEETYRISRNEGLNSFLIPSDCGKPAIHKVVTVILYNNNLDETQKSISYMASYYPAVQMIIASNGSISRPGVTWHTPRGSLAETWNSLVKAVSTPYVWVGRDVSFFDGHNNLRRLILELELSEAVIAAGSTRDTNSTKWSRNCYQTSFYNYRLKYSDHYSHSTHSCLHCSYAEGPFMIRRNDFLQYELLADIKDEEFTFLDFYLRATGRDHGSSPILHPRLVLVCPDSMAEVQRRRQDDSNPRLADLVKWVSKHEIHEIQLPNRPELEPLLTCAVIPYDCKRQSHMFTMRPLTRFAPHRFIKGSAGYLLSPCCKHELKYAMTTTQQFLEKLKINYYIMDGTLLGALKFGDVLPWEIDGDIGYEGSKAQLLMTAKSQFEAKGLQLDELSPWNNATNVRSKYWVIEMYYVPSFDWTSVTRVKLGEKYFPVARNPGKLMRDRYGHEIYRHSEHWRVLGHRSSATLYTSGFSPCPVPGYHTCIDNFSIDGDSLARGIT